MPRLPGWAWLLLAIGFATLATYMAMGYLKRQAAVQPPKEKTSMVVVAKSAIDPASRVSRRATQDGSLAPGEASSRLL